MTPDQYISLANGVFDLSMAEAQKALQNDQERASLYPKIVVMYEFFRLVRGEAFTDFRPPTPDSQQNLYEKEAELSSVLDQVKAKIDFNDERTKAYIDQLVKPYFQSE